MSDAVITPPPFSGKPTEDPGDWLRAFSNYCTFKGYNDAQKRNLFRVLLTGPAAHWLDNRTFSDTAMFDNYKTDFEARYKTPEVMKYKSARQIFTRSQEDEETTDDYSTSMIKLGKVIRVTQKNKFIFLNFQPLVVFLLAKEQNTIFSRIFVHHLMVAQSQQSFDHSV